MVARKDAGIKTVADLKGKKLGYADPDSTSGYLVPLVTLPEALGAPLTRLSPPPASAAVTKTSSSKS